MVLNRNMRNVLMELRKVCQHPYLSAPELENEDAPEEEQHRALTNGSGKLAFLKLLLPKLRERGHRVLLFSQFKIALDRIEDFLYGEGYKFLRLDGDVQQAKRQKAMDVYNAPDSEYFIFLLTTRAGGVGINLASADTVIIYDPDFNPHMDLQAISRSHRYGQTKRVLVFKLMTKNSVEEQIILNGKKKMVLDHLIVQQMGKENEEGDIDDLLLRGAAALYDANEDGIAASDIRYTSKDVDGLIDKVQADAEAEARAMEEREREKERAKAAGEVEEQAKPKETMSFGFAKIWEADRNQLEELAEDADEVDTNAWQLVMDRAQRAQEAQRLAMVESGRQKRQAAMVKYGPYGPDGVHSGSDHNDTPKQKRKYTKKGKRKAGTSSEDADFVGGLESSDSETDSVGSIPDLEDLRDAEGRPVLTGLVAGQALTKKQKTAAYRAQLALKQQAQNGAVIPPMDPNINGLLVSTAEDGVPRVPGKRAETPEERAARKAKRRAEKASEKKKRYDAFTAWQAGAGRNAHTVPPPHHAERSRVHLDPHTLSAGQQICQYLYHSLRELGYDQALQSWALMALPELPAAEREEIYRKLAADADAELIKRHGPGRGYFNHWEQTRIVMALLKHGYPVIPEGPEPLPMPALPKDRGWKLGENGYERPTTLGRASPYQSPQVIHAVPPPAANGLNAELPNGHARQPSLPHASHDQGQRRELFDALMESASQQTCPSCGGDHALKDCTKAELEDMRIAILRGDNGDLELRKEAISQIDQMLRLHAASNTPSFQSVSQDLKMKLSSSQLTTGQASPLSTRPANLPRANGSLGMGNRDAPIVVANEDEDDARSAKRQRRSQQFSERFMGCRICGDTSNHPANSCPVVHRGPDAIKEAMRTLEPSDPLWLILRSLYDQSTTAVNTPRSSQSHPCAFCETACGRTIRSCAELNGGRKALKGKIKELENARMAARTEGEASRAKALVEELYDSYLKWPRVDPM